MFEVKITETAPTAAQIVHKVWDIAKRKKTAVDAAGGIDQDLHFYATEVAHMIARQCHQKKDFVTMNGYTVALLIETVIAALKEDDRYVYDGFNMSTTQEVMFAVQYSTSQIEFLMNMESEYIPRH